MTNQKRHGEKRENLALALLFTGLFFFALSCRYDFYYDLNDDTAIRDILSGIHTGTPSAYSVQMLYPLSWLLSLLYRIFPKAPVFGAFLCLCQYGSIVMLTYRFVSFMPGNAAGEKRWQGLVYKILCLVGVLLLLTALLLYQLIYIQYSVVSGLLMATAIFYVLTGKKKERTEQGSVLEMAVFLPVLLSFCIRTEVCMMLSPFLGLALWYRWSESKVGFTWQGLRPYAVFAGILGISIALLTGIHAVAYRTADWKSFNQFFDARTQLYDFIGIPDETQEENGNLYAELGLQKEEAALLHNYNFALDGRIDADILTRLVAARQQQVGEQMHPDQPLYQYGPIFTTRNFSQALYHYKQQWMTDEAGAWYYSILIGYVLLLMAGCLLKKSGIYWKTFFLFAFRTAIWIYLLLGERTPDRIIVPLYLTELLMLLALLYHTVCSIEHVEQRAIQRMANWWRGAIILLLMVVALLYIGNGVAETDREARRRAEINTQWQTLQDYCNQHPEQYYLIDVYSTVQYSEKIFADVDNAYRNYDICGGWLAKSPLTAGKLQRAGVTDTVNLDEELANNPALYFISYTDRDTAWLQDYYSAKGEDITITAIETVMPFTIYQIHETAVKGYK